MGRTHNSALNETASESTHPTKFKVFVQGATETLSALCERVEQFAAATPSLPKSIGIEFLESKGVNIITLGYDPKGTPTRISLATQEIGNVLEALAPGEGDKLDLAGIEFRMAEFSAKFANSICHEVSIREDGAMTMLVMSVKPALVTEGPTAK
jgi:hypothetical protein